MVILAAPNSVPWGSSWATTALEMNAYELRCLVSAWQQLLAHPAAARSEEMHGNVDFRNISSRGLGQNPESGFGLGFPKVPKWCPFLKVTSTNGSVVLLWLSCGPVLLMYLPWRLVHGACGTAWQHNWLSAVQCLTNRFLSQSTRMQLYWPSCWQSTHILDCGRRGAWVGRASHF